MTLRIATLLCAVLSAAAGPRDSKPYLAIVEKVAGAVGFYTEDGRLLAQVKVGSYPHEAVLSKNGRLYVTDNGVLWMTEDRMGSNTISIIDVRRQQVVGTVATGKGPGRIAITPDGKTLVYNLQFEPAVGFADVASGKQTDVVPLSGRPLSLTMTRDGSRAFAGIQDQDKVCFISVAGRKIEHVLDLPKGSGPDPAIPPEE